MMIAGGGVLAALSIYQGEFDFGVPQFRLLFHPVLLAFAAGVALTMGRIVAGRGAALGAVAFFVLVRGVMHPDHRRRLRRGRAALPALPRRGAAGRGRRRC